MGSNSMVFGRSETEDEETLESNRILSQNFLSGPLAAQCVSLLNPFLHRPVFNKTLDDLCSSSRLGLRPTNAVLLCQGKLLHCPDSAVHRSEPLGEASMHRAVCLTQPICLSTSIRNDSSGSTNSPSCRLQYTRNEIVEVTPDGLSGPSDTGGSSLQFAVPAASCKSVASQRLETAAEGTSGVFDRQDCSKSALRHNAEPISLRSSVLRYSEHRFCRFLLWLGPLTERRRSNDQSPYYEVLKPSDGYGTGFAMTLYWYSPFKVELAVYLLKVWRGPSRTFSVHWNLSFPTVVAWETDIVRLTLCGDIDAVQEAVRIGKANIFSVLPDGSTLLHVSP